ncbi:phage tail protein [Acinetobacter haemolyticus]|uniref:phage tail protein n=1 Tax=Acinetobacter haemolyticus TaxID=29430 RepID=UPI000E587D51|nr:phage tail protein [Acinetobacter haemolyticus]QDJ92677.1 phage tail protein [Acinetobacter haemolyticus]
MSDRTFTWDCDLDGNSHTQNFNVLTSVFGDGYEQNTSVGINNRKGEWRYQRTASLSEIQAIKTFFDDHKGTESFLWQSPLDGLVRVKTDTNYTPSQIGGDVWQISTMFKQVFHP